MEPVTTSLKLIPILERTYQAIVSYLKGKKRLEYDTEELLSYYHRLEDTGTLLEDTRFNIRTPYEVIFDYRQNSQVSWGVYTFNGTYKYPALFASLRKKIIEELKSKGKLNKGDNPSIRICDYSVKDGQLSIIVQKARYFDQVGTNLILDRPFKRDMIEEVQAKNMREWDRVQSNLRSGDLPSLSQSRLANTIGVGMGIRAKRNDGVEVIVLRKRSKNVMIGESKWGLPLSFALSYTEATLEENGTINKLIMGDLLVELSQELGIENESYDSTKIVPLMLCRELVRGGKPEFFLELESSISYENLTKKIKENESLTPEFTNEIIGLTKQELISDSKYHSYAVLAYLALSK